MPFSAWYFPPVYKAMSQFADLPVYDDQGLHLVDPSDTSGRKTQYLSILHAQALHRYLGSGSGLALDVGCGYARMSAVLRQLGHEVVGLDLSLRVLKAARKHDGLTHFCCGALPDLPFAPASFDTVLLQNVLRVLHLLGKLDAGWSVASMVAPGGRLAVIDNSRAGHADFVPEQYIVAAFEAAGLRLLQRHSIRASRWPLIYMIRYGLVPRRWYARIAAWELRRMARKQRAPRWSYHNVLFVFERPR